MLKVEPPSFLTDGAQREFRRIVAELGDTLRDLDLSVVADYAQTFDDVVSLQQAITLVGTVVVNSKNGAIKTNPDCNLLMAKRSQLASLRKELGLNPTQRKEKPKKDGKSLKDTLAEKRMARLERQRAEADL